MRKRTNAAQGMFALRCGECDRLMVETPSGWLSCPMGHGRLWTADEVADPPDFGGKSLFDPIPEGVADGVSG